MQHLELGSIHLAYGKHPTRQQGVCLLEAVAWFASEAHSNHPTCVSPLLGGLGRAWNDTLDDTTRQGLVGFIPRLVGTAADGTDQKRAWMLTDWLARTYAPALLRTAGLTLEAQRLEQAPPVTGPEPAASLLPTLEAASKLAWAAFEPAAAGQPTQDADAAEAVARALPVGAVWAAARDELAAAWAPGGVAWGFVSGAQPAIAQIQASGFELLGRLCDAARTATT